MKLTIECDCGAVYVIEGDGTFNNPKEDTNLDMYIQESDWIEDDMVVIECDECAIGKIRIRL